MSGILRLGQTKSTEQDTAQEKKMRTDLEERLLLIWKSYKKEKDPVQKRNLRAQLIEQAFLNEGAGYTILSKSRHKKLRSEIQKVETCAKEIFDFQGSTLNTFLATHAKDTAFALDQKHFIYKHIEKLNEWKKKHGLQADYRIRVEHSVGLVLHTGVSLASLIQEEQNNSGILFDLDHFALRRKDVDNPSANLQPNFQVKGDGHYHVEIVTNAKKRPLPEGNHSWIRLVTKEGAVYSVGKYPKKTPSLGDIYAQSEVFFHSSDLTEWSEKDACIEAHSLKVTEEQFERLKKSIEEDLRQQKESDYQAFEDNCTDWLIRKISLLNDPETDEKTYTVDREEIRCQQLETLFPRIASFTKRFIPRFIRGFAVRFLLICTHITNLFIALVLGGHKKNKQNAQSKPVIRQENLTNTRFTYITHPFYLKAWVKEHWKERLEDKSTSHPKQANNVDESLYLEVINL